MTELTSLVDGFLTAAGFKCTPLGRLCACAERPLFAGDRDVRLVWTAPPEATSIEPAVRGSIGEYRRRFPEAWAALVVHSRSGLSRPFLEYLTEQRIRVLVPGQFFDTDFKVDQAPQMRSAIASLRSTEILCQRVPQPYVLDGDAADGADSRDLLATLLEELKQPQESRLRLVVGKAGIGKTFLFRALFAELYSAFADAKARQSSRARPIPFLPEHLKNALGLRTELLVESFLQSDVASPVSRQAFEWLLVNGFSTWLFDGLDELYAGDARFFEYLADLLTRPGSQAQILIWSRDSLLTTSEAFLELQDTVGGGDLVTVYRLRDWQPDSKRQFAWLRLEGALPRPGQADTPPVAQFLARIQQAPTLSALSGVPFYCGLLLDQFKSGQVQDFTNDIALLDGAVRSMVEREVGKGLLNLSMLEANGLSEWLELVACDYVERGQVSREDAQGYGSMVVAKGVTPAEQENLLTTLLQFPLFAGGPESGTVRFAHDLIAELLAARGHLKTLKRSPADVARQLAGIDLAEPNLIRFMAWEASEPHIEAVAMALRGADLPGHSFAVLLALYLLAKSDHELLRRAGILLEGRDLTGVEFTDRDLSGQSFRTADLSHAEFVRCYLRNAAFEGAYLNRTRFDEASDLEGAEFGDLGRAQGILTPNGLLEDLSEIRVWVGRRTSKQSTTPEPCPATLRLLHLFRKFVQPDGQPRRDDLKRGGLVSGRHFGNVAPTEDVLTECVRRGYLTGPDPRDRYRRPAGEKYQQIVEFVRDGRASRTLQEVFVALCRRRGCSHEARAWR